MSRVLFVVDRLPFPPRTGITIASCDHLRGLVSAHEVDILWLKKEETPVCNDQLAANRKFVNKLWILDSRNNGLARPLLRECLVQQPFFTSRRLDIKVGQRLLAGHSWDVVWCEPIVPFSYFRDIRAMIGTDPGIWVAAISDVYTALLRSAGASVLQAGWLLQARLRNMMSWVRSWGMALMESRLLSNADIILVQTPQDRRWVSRISKGRLAEKTYIMPNGVNESLFEVPIERDEFTIGYIGSLANPEHARSVYWLIKKVWPAVKQRLPRAKFVVIGQDGPPQLMGFVSTDPNIVHIPYVKDVRDLYPKCAALVVCNYKNVGLINRTLEAMAAGTMVVGHPGAFNGIAGFKSGVHGFVVNSAEEIVKVVTDTFSGGIDRVKIATAGRELIRANFNWGDTAEKIDDLLVSVLNSKASP